MMLPPAQLAGPALVRRVRAGIAAADLALALSEPEPAPRFPDRLVIKDPDPPVRAASPNQTRAARVKIEPRYVRWRHKLAGIEC